MVTLSENSAECSSTTPHLESSREHFGSNIVSSTNNNSSSSSATTTNNNNNEVSVPPPPPAIGKKYALKRN